MPQPIRPLPVHLWLVLAAAGCAAQAPPEYPGEPLQRVVGRVVNDLSMPTVPDAVVLANWGVVGAMFPPTGTVAEIEGEFPARFSLTLYEPPPEEMLYNPATSIVFSDASFSMGDPNQRTGQRGEHPFDPARESRIALARIVAVATGANGPDMNQTLGASEQHVLLYAEEDLPEDSYAAALVHAPLSAGYHLLEVRDLDPEDERAVLECEVAATSMEAWKACGLNSRLHPVEGANEEVTVRLADDSQLQFPSYAPVWLEPSAPIDPSPLPCDPMLPMNPCS